MCILFQLYPFGYINGDYYLYYGDESSTLITLRKNLYFYNEFISTAYVS